MRNKPVTTAEIRQIAEQEGPEYAHDLLLLGGPEFFDGSYIEYCDLLEGFEAEIADSAWGV